MCRIEVFCSCNEYASKQCFTPAKQFINFINPDLALEAMFQKELWRKNKKEFSKMQKLPFLAVL